MQEDYAKYGCDNRNSSDIDAIAIASSTADISNDTWSCIGRCSGDTIMEGDDSQG